MITDEQVQGANKLAAVINPILKPALHNKPLLESISALLIMASGLAKANASEIKAEDFGHFAAMIYSETKGVNYRDLN